MESISSQKGVGRMKMARLAVFACTALVLVGCSEEDKAQIRRWALPEPASDRADAIFDLWVGAWVASAVVFVLVFGLMLYAMIRYRRKSDDEVPSQLRYHLPLEVLYTIAPLIVVAVFFYHTVVVQNATLEDVEGDPDHVIEVVGSKWQWTFNYLDPEGVNADSVYDQGSVEELPTLVLPVGESVRFSLVSPDVIHSFWIPEFYFKQDIIPGRTIDGENPYFDMTPTRTGEFIGRCAELCGVYHTRMLFRVQIVEPDEYAAHLRSLEAAGQVGRPTGPSNAYQVAGLENGDN